MTEVCTYCVDPVPEAVPLGQEDATRIGMLVSRPIEAEEADGHQSSELKTMNGIGVGAEADGVYVCIAENNRTAGSRNISIDIRGLWSTFSLMR